MKWRRKRPSRHHIFAPPTYFRSNRKLSVFNQREANIRNFVIKPSLSDSLSLEKTFCSTHLIFAFFLQKTVNIRFWSEMRGRNKNLIRLSSPTRSINPVKYLNHYIFGWYFIFQFTYGFPENSGHLRNPYNFAVKLLSYTLKKIFTKNMLGF